MSEASITESGMTFGPFANRHCFRIEQSTCYRKMQEGIQMAEFVLLRQQRQGLVLWIVEAKSSSPQPQTSPNFKTFIDEIHAKFSNAFLLTISRLLQRHPEARDELSDGFKELDLKSQGFRFVLVINGHKQAWLPPLQSALELTLRPLRKTWNISILVLNHELALKHHLVQPPTA